MRSKSTEEGLIASDKNLNSVVISNPRLNQLIFPYHLLKRQNYLNVPVSPSSQTYFYSHSLMPSFNALRSLRSSIFQKVHAAEKEEVATTGDGEEVATTGDGDNKDDEQIRYSKRLEAFAKIYIQQESGQDRVKMLFEKDHRGKTDLELSYIQVSLVQVFVITFFFKYFPVARFARKEFIRENQATVFRTRFEAVRRLQDHTFLKAGSEAAAFSTKMTLFSASFLFMSSMISSYRNKTSVLEYAVAAGITGGLARLNMGIKGFIAGSVVGGVLGSAVGLIGYLSLSAYGITQEERHVEAIKSKLEVMKSIEGDSVFRTRVNELLAEDNSLLTTPSS